MTIFEALQSTGLPCAYAFFKTKQEPPYIVYIGDGQNTMKADNTVHWSTNAYQVEYYFTQKNESNESSIEKALLDAGFIYEKSEDVYIEGEDVFVIYYRV